MKSYKHLVNYAIKAGLTVSVHDGEEWPVKKSTNKALIYEHIEGVEECSLRFRNSENEIVGWAFITPFEEDDYTVCDYSVTPFMEQWNEAHNLTISNH